MAENRLTLIIKTPDSGDDKKTAAYPRRRPRRIGRRRAQPRMNFWDLGMVKTGPEYHEWEMLDFQPSIPASFATSTNAFNSTYHDELLDKIFEVPVEDWKGHYKRIVPEMDYRLNVWSYDFNAINNTGSVEVLSASNPDFTNGGLKPDDAWFEGGFMPAVGVGEPHLPVFTLTLLGESVLTHITTENDITAPAADFTPSKQMEVYMVPALPQMRGRITYFDSGTQYTQQLNDFWHLYDRGIFLTSSHDLYNHRSGHFGVEAGLDTIYNSGAYTRWADVLTYMKGFVGARARYSTDGGSTWPTSDDGSNFGAVIPDPYPTFPPNGIASSAAVLASLNANSTSFFTLPGNPQNQMRLKCVIKQNGTFYYVWNIAYT